MQVRPFLIALICLNIQLGYASTLLAETAPRVRVRATGQAPTNLPNAREAAIENALRRAVEAGGGVQLAGVSASQEFGLVKDMIIAQTAGFIERYEVLAENPDQEGLYTVRVSAIVTRGEIDANVAAFKSLLKRNGHPRVMLVSDPAMPALSLRLKVQLQGILEKKGIKVLHAPVAAQLRVRDEERATFVDENTKKAELVAKQLGADVLMLASVEMDEPERSESFGLTRTSVNAIGTLQLIRADTAEVLGSVVQEQVASGSSVAAAGRAASKASLEQATEKAIGRIAQHWLAAVDQRQGRQIHVVMHQFPFTQATHLIQSLRQVPGVRSVIVDRTDAQATGQLRVTTNATAPNLAMALRKIDPKLKVVSSSSNRVDVK